MLNPAAGPPGTSYEVQTIAAAAADYDRDGDLDLFTARWGTLDGGAEANGAPHPASHLWRNNGDLTFTAIDQMAGLAGLQTFPDNTFTPNFADINGDGWPDLLVVADFGESRVFLNQRDGTFRDATTDVISERNGMGAAVGDYDNDGDLDWFVSGISDPNGIPEGNWGANGNRLYRNRGDGSFDDATDEAGVREGYWGWGSCFADFDNDGYPRPVSRQRLFRPE